MLKWKLKFEKKFNFDGNYSLLSQRLNNKSTFLGFFFRNLQRSLYCMYMKMCLSSWFLLLAYINVEAFDFSKKWSSHCFEFWRIIRRGDMTGRLFFNLHNQINLNLYGVCAMKYFSHSVTNRKSKDARISKQFIDPVCQDINLLPFS